VDRAFCRDKAVFNGFHHLINTGLLSRFLLSANGAASNPAWGIAPGNVKSKGRER